LSSSLNNTNISDAYSVVPTGFNSVDKLINGGFEKGELNLIAAAPGTGKTAFALNVFAHECEKLLHFDVSNQNRKPPIVYYVSLEMTAPQILERLISINTGKSFKFSNFNSNKYSELDKEIFQAAFDNISKYPAKMNANFKASITDIRGQISLLASSHDIKLVIIDHLHIMDYDRNNENQEIAGITKNLKQIAKEYQLPIVLLSQVNKSKNTFGGESKKFGFNKDQVKEEETSSNKIFLSDIRGSGAPVQDSSIIILM
jgi:replicative DNA helicase